MDQLKSSLKKLNVDYTQGMIDKFNLYMEGILSWNEKINLTAITDKEDFVNKHFVDSILCNDFEEFKDAGKIIDVGTGAGFPGVPLAIINPGKKFVLADSLNKRIKVISNLTWDIGIDNVILIHGRAEELAHKKEHRQIYDACVSRAVANLSVLCEYCLPFIRVGGHLFAYKGPDASEEVKAAEKSMKILGGKLERVQRVNLDGFDHNIIVIKKIRSTPAKYPRKAGTPSKEPI